MQTTTQPQAYLLAYTLRTEEIDTDHYIVFSELDNDNRKPFEQAAKRLETLVQQYQRIDSRTELYSFNIARIEQTNEHYNTSEDPAPETPAKPALDAPPDFPNGFTNWHETHFEVVSFIIRNCDDNDGEGTGAIALINMMESIGGLFETAAHWTNEFEKLHAGREWDGEYYDEIEAFCEMKNAN